MCTKQETHDFTDKFNEFIGLLKKLHKLHENWWIWKKTLNLALPTGGSEKTEIKGTTGLLIWLKLRDTCTHTHTSKFYWNYWKIAYFEQFEDFPCMYWYIETETTSENPKLTSSEARPLPSGRCGVAPGVHHKRRPLDLTVFQWFSPEIKLF